MSYSIGTAAAQVVANAEGFTSGLKTAEQQLAEFDKNLAKGEAARAAQAARGGGLGEAVGAGAQGLSGMAKTALAGAAAFVGLSLSVEGFVSWLRQGISEVVSLKREADKLGLTTEQMQALQLAAGPAAESLGQALNHLARELGQVRQGSDEASTKFRRLGLDGAALAQMPFAQAFGTIADKVRGLSSASDRSALAFQLFGRQGRQLLPLLAKGSEGMEKAAKRAQELGISIGAAGAGQAALAAGALRELDAVVKSVGQQFAVGLSPFVTEAVNKFLEWVKASGGVKTVVAGALTALVNVLADAVDLVTELIDDFRDLSKTMQGLQHPGASIAGFADNFNPAKAAVKAASESLTTQLGNLDTGKLGDKVRKTLRDSIAKMFAGSPGAAEAPAVDLSGAIGDVEEKLSAQANAFGLAGAALELYKLKEKGATEAELAEVAALGAQIKALEFATGTATASANVFQDAAAKAGRLKALLHDGAITTDSYRGAISKLNDELQRAQFAKAGQLFTETLTPLEQFAGKLQEIDLLFKRGRISGETMARAVFKDFTALESAVGKAGEWKLPGAVTAGSKEALSVVAKAEAQQRGADPQVRVAQAVERALETAKQQKLTQDAILAELKKKGTTLGRLTLD